MATPIISDISDEQSEVEGIVKLEPDERELKSLQYVYETDEGTDQDPKDEDVVFKDLPPHKQRLYNEMVQFQTELHEKDIVGSLRCIIHGQQEQINPPMPEEVA